MFHLGMLPGELSPVLGSPPEERHWCTKMSLVEDQQAGKGAGAHGIQAKTERERGACSARRRDSCGKTWLLSGATSVMGTDKVRADSLMTFVLHYGKFLRSEHKTLTYCFSTILHLLYYSLCTDDILTQSERQYRMRIVFWVFLAATINKINICYHMTGNYHS